MTDSIDTVLRMAGVWRGPVRLAGVMPALRLKAVWPKEDAGAGAAPAPSALPAPPAPVPLPAPLPSTDQKGGAR